MNHDFEYISMKEMIDRSRKGLGLLNEEVGANPNILGDKDPELQQKTLDSNNTDEKITLDSPPNEAVIIGNVQQGVSDKIKIGFQSILNKYLELMSDSILRADRISIKINDTSVQLTIVVIMKDDQPATILYDTQSGKVQLKYENFLELSQENVNMMAKTAQYFGNEELKNEIITNLDLA